MGTTARPTVRRFECADCGVGVAKDGADSLGYYTCEIHHEWCGACQDTGEPHGHRAVEAQS